MQDRLLEQFSVFIQSEREAFLEDLKSLVQSESPSTSINDLGRTVGILKEMIERITGITPKSEVIQGKTLLSITYGENTGKRVLVLCHYDTVWPVGTLSRLPFRVDGNTCAGPGVFDMKSGILMALYAIKFLRYTGNKRSVTILITPDEEIGSETSKDMIIRMARSSDAVLVLEASEKGMLKVGRKGVGTFKIEAIGKASHAGLDPDAGINAITEISHLVHYVEKFADREKGTSVNVGIIRGGTRTNVVPETAEIEIDVRVKTQAESERIEQAFKSLKPHDRRIHLLVSGGIERPPMERNETNDALFNRVQSIGREIGMDLQACEVGGASDGNFVSAAGVPVIDGMGAVGEGAHSLSEKIDISATLSRILLVAAVILYI